MSLTSTAMMILIPIRLLSVHLIAAQHGLVDKELPRCCRLVGQILHAIGGQDAASHAAPRALLEPRIIAARHRAASEEVVCFVGAARGLL